MKNTYICSHCGISFERYAVKNRSYLSHYCSRACHAAGQFKHGKNAAGYEIVRVDGKQVYKHRWLMEQHLGRKLAPNEHVHHKNGDKGDNRLDNLEVVLEAEHHMHHVEPTFDVDEAKRLYEQGYGYRKLSQQFGVARQNIYGLFVRRGWHVPGRTRTTIKRDYGL